MMIQKEERRQEPFSRVTGILKAALLLATFGGFTGACVLTLTRALSFPLGEWWSAVVQVHGHLQLYGWVGLFVVGVALHFLPRLRGVPLVGVRFLPVLLVLVVSSLIVRTIFQPGLVVLSTPIWRIGLIASGVGEAGAFLGLLTLFVLTARRGPPLSECEANLGVFPFFLGAFCSLLLAALVNLVNVVQAAWADGMIAESPDVLNTTLGLFGFLVPMALAMSARSLPMYGGRTTFPRRLFWSLSGAYFFGLAMLDVSQIDGLLPAVWGRMGMGFGMALLGGAVLIFLTYLWRGIRKPEQRPLSLTTLVPGKDVQRLSRERHKRSERMKYGPYVRIVISAYLWALLGAVLLLLDGGSLLVMGTEWANLDAARHSFALGFLTLLITGLAPRMLSGFSGRHIFSARLVSVTFWLGNTAALVRVGASLLTPLLISSQGSQLLAWLLALSGVCGLLLIAVLTVNLWPTLSDLPSQAM